MIEERVHPSQERQWRIDEIAELWHVSRQMITRLFEHRDDICKLPGASLSGRPYSTILIPDSTMKRVYDEWRRGPLLEINPRRRRVK